MDNCLKLFQILFKMFSISQTLRANAAKRQILGQTQLVVIAVTAFKVFSTASATLEKNYLSAKDAADSIDELLDVIITFN